MRDAVREQSLDTGPSGNDLNRRNAARGGIAVARNLDIATKLPCNPCDSADAEHAESVAGCSS